MNAPCSGPPTLPKAFLTSYKYNKKQNFEIEAICSFFACNIEIFRKLLKFLEEMDKT